MLKQQALALIVTIVALSLLFTGGTALASEPHWSYSGDSGPENWGALSPTYALCASGVEQSPIDIAASSPLNRADLQFNYQSSALTIVNNGHTIQANYDEGSTLQVGDQSYSLVQFHFHNPSEHTIDGSAIPMELHLVHQNREGGLAVVALFLAEGAENAALAAIIDNMPEEEGEPLAIDGTTIDAAAMLPAEQSYWRYDGSLTTPPCHEAVKWHVMQTPIELSAKQIEAYTDIFTGNARPNQPLNQRDFIASSALVMIPMIGAADNPLVIIMVVVGTAVVLGVILRYSTRRKRTAQG